MSEDGWNLGIGKSMQGGRDSLNKSTEIEAVQSVSRARDQNPVCLLCAWGPCLARTCSLPHPLPLGRWAHGTGLRGGCRHVCPWPSADGTTCTLPNPLLSGWASLPVWVMSMCGCLGRWILPGPASTLHRVPWSCLGMWAPLVAWTEDLLLEGVIGVPENRFWD